MDPELTPEQARYELDQIRRTLREGGAGLAEAEQYATERLGFPDYRTFVYYAQNGVMPDKDPDQARADVGRMGAMGRFGAAVAGGIPFSDELVGLFSEGAGDRMNARREVLREDYPGASFAAEMIPGFAIPVGGAAAASGRLAQAGVRPLLATAGGAAAGGALEGALYGAGEGEGLRERARNALGGAVMGGVAGGLFGGALGVGGAAGRRVLRGVSERAGERQGRNFAGRWFQRWFDENPEINPDVIDARLEELGPEAIVADAAPVPGGRGIYAARTLAGGQLDMPGGPSQRLAGRHLERGDRIANDLMFATDARGIPVEGKVDEAVDALRARAQNEYYGPVDEEFGAFALDEVPELLDLFRQDPGLAEAAQRVMGDVNRPLRFSDFQQLRNAMRARLQRMEGDPQAAIGAREQLGRRIDALTNAMHESFGDRVAQADRLWAQGSSMLEAYEAGLKLGSSNSPLRLQRAMARDFANLSPENRMATLAGVVDRLGQKIIDSPTGGSAGSKIVNEARAMREFLTEVLGEEGYQGLESAIQREQAFQTTHNYGGLNSLTAMRGEDVASMRESISRPGVNRWEWMRKIGEFFTDTADLERAKGRAIGEALMAGDTGPVRELLDRGGRFGPRIGSSSGEIEAMLAAGLQSPINQWLLGQYLAEGDMGASF